MKGRVTVEQRNEIVRSLRAHDRVALNRLAQAVEARQNQIHSMRHSKYSRMHHRHNKSMANRG